MKYWIVMVALAGSLTPPAAQVSDPISSPGGFGRDRPNRMPDGRDRTLVILKQDVEKSTEDMAKVVELAQELLTDVEKNKFHTVDLRSVRKADEIIKLVRRVKSRMVRHQ